MSDEFEQKLETGPVIGQPWDLVLRFTSTSEQPELLLEEKLKFVLEALVANFGTIVVKVNWFADGLKVYAAVPSQDGSGATKDIDPSLN